MYTNSVRTNTYFCASVVIIPCRHLTCFPIKLPDPLSLYRETHFILVISRLVALCEDSIGFFHVKRVRTRHKVRREDSGIRSSLEETVAAKIHIVH
jgi:hypothetical protein